MGFTPWESPAIYGGDNINKTSIRYRKGGVDTPFFFNGVYLWLKGVRCQKRGIVKNQKGSKLMQ